MLQYAGIVCRLQIGIFSSEQMLMFIQRCRVLFRWRKLFVPPYWAPAPRNRRRASSKLHYASQLKARYKLFSKWIQQKQIITPIIWNISWLFLKTVKIYPTFLTLIILFVLELIQLRNWDAGIGFLSLNRMFRISLAPVMVARVFWFYLISVKIGFKLLYIWY